MRVRVRSGESLREETVHMAAAAAASRAHDDLDCPPEDLVLSEDPPGLFRIEGCGDWASYRCTHQHCSLQDRGTLATAPAGPSWTDEHVGAIAQRVHDDVAACLPSGIPPTLRLRVRLSRTGRVIVRDRAAFAPSVAGCVDHRLVAVGLRGMVDEGRTVTFTVRGATFVDALAAAAPAPSNAPVPEVPAEPDVPQESPVEREPRPADPAAPAEPAEPSSPS
jgi:hypothetical protein